MTLSALRSLFPHTAHTVYLNHAAVAPLSRPVVSAVQSYLSERGDSAIENYPIVQPVLEEARRWVGELLHVDASTIAWTPNTSYALNVLAQGLPWQPGDRIAVPACEFPANVYPFLNLQQRGVFVDFIPHREAVIRMEDIDAVLTPSTRLLTISWVQFLSGYRVDIEALGALCRSRGVLLCVDAIQGLGALELDAEAAQIDFLACGGHKWLMAPQGIGFLYVRPELMERLHPMAGWLHGPVDWDNFLEYDLQFHPDARRFHPGTLNSLGVIALHAALAVYRNAGSSRCEAAVRERAVQLVEGLVACGYQPYGTVDPAHGSGIVTFRHPDAEGLHAHLTDHGIKGALRNRLIRLAPTYYNSPDEIDRTLGLIADY